MALKAPGEPIATGSITIGASPESVYDLVSDPQTMTTFAEETKWILHRRASVGKAGSHWLGLNKRGWHVWPTNTAVSDADRGRRFAFEVSILGLPVSRWQYDFEPTADGVAVTETAWDRRPSWFAPITVPFTGVTDRASANTASISKTLARLKLIAEGAQ